MQGEEFRAIRVKMGKTRSAFAAYLGYTGNERNTKRRVRAFESGEEQIPLYIARLAWLCGELHNEHLQATENGDPASYPAMTDENGEVEWPAWPGYNFESVPDSVHEKGDEIVSND